jgi:hypothetical protein
MVSSENPGTSSPAAAYRMAAISCRSDGVAAALHSIEHVERRLPADMLLLIERLDALPDRANGCG